MTAKDDWKITTSVGLTALAVAAGRATETHREDPLIVDPYAETLVHQADAPANLPTRPAGGDGDGATDTIFEHGAQYIGIRTRYFDQYFHQALDDTVRQAVILASGLDTRAFRLPWPDGTRVFELDQPDVLAFKSEVLCRAGASPTCWHQPIGIDLRDDWMSGLCEAGFDPNQPTAWLAEGLLPYLPSDALQQLLDGIGTLSAPGSALSVEDIPTPSRTLDHHEIAQVRDMLGIDITTLMHDEPDRPTVASWLSEHGWAVTAESVEHTSQRYGRTLDHWTGLLQNQRYIMAHLPTGPTNTCPKR